jgi:hypothetical protein
MWKIFVEVCSSITIVSLLDVIANKLNLGTVGRKEQCHQFARRVSRDIHCSDVAMQVKHLDGE